MNGYQRIRAALAGQAPDTTPVMLHNFMMAAREAGMTMAQYRSDPREMARAHIEAVEKYGYDGIMIDVDTATLAGAAGVPVEFPEDEPALSRRPLLSSLEDAGRLEPVDISRYPGVQAWLEGVRLIKEHFGDEIYIRGNCDQAAFSLACQLRGSQEWLMDLTDEDNCPLITRLLEHCHAITVQFLELMAKTGCDMLSNGDSSAGTSLISPRLYRRFGKPYQTLLADVSHRLGLPWALHVCGNTNPILADLADTGADGLELDFKTDIQRAHAILKDRVVFIGNIDPSAVLAMGTPELIESKVRELRAVFSDTPRLVVNAGCAIPANTPPANLQALIRAAHC